jgi:hypothetical protein
MHDPISVKKVHDCRILCSIKEKEEDEENEVNYLCMSIITPTMNEHTSDSSRRTFTSIITNSSG